MAEKEQPPPPSTLSSSSSSQVSKSTAYNLPSRPTITLPPRSSMETLFNGGGGPGLGGLGFSPGPMTLLSSFFSDTDDCRSFSQLLAGAMTSPAAIPSHQRQGFPPPDEGGSGAGDDDFRFRPNRPPNSAVPQSPIFTVPPGLSPAGLLDSPGLFSPGGQVILSMSSLVIIIHLGFLGKYVLFCLVAEKNTYWNLNFICSLWSTGDITGILGNGSNLDAIVTMITKLETDMCFQLNGN